MSMKYLAAYALASLNKSSPSACDVEAICKACNIEVDADSLAFVMDSIQGRSVAALVAEGAAKMSAVASSGAGGAAAGGAAASAAGGSSAAPAAAAAAAAAKEEEEEDDDMGFGLFD